MRKGGLPTPACVEGSSAAASFHPDRAVFSCKVNNVLLTSPRRNYHFVMEASGRLRCLSKSRKYLRDVAIARPGTDTRETMYTKSPFPLTSVPYSYDDENNRSREFHRPREQRSLLARRARRWRKRDARAARSPIRWIMRGDVTGLRRRPPRIPTGGVPPSG